MKVSNDGILYNSYQKNKNILIKQLNTYAADLMIFGNTFKYFREDLGFSDSDLNKEKKEFILGEKKWLNTYISFPSGTEKDIYRNL